jgi:dihydroorotate dehydrogenase
LPRDRALVNRMGFNNPGARAVARALGVRRPDGVVLGVNLGKSKVTPLADAPDDYAESARALAPLADYVVINVSSPNTAGLRSLQATSALRPIVAAVQHELSRQPNPPALLVKIAPDLSDDEIDEVVDLCQALGLAGIVATNTTVERAGLGLATSDAELARVGDGGLSGAPLRARSLAVIRRIYARTRGALLIIGVGGIETAEQAWETLRAGATLLQLYTSLVYKGPALARAINAGLVARLAQSGHARIEDVVGAGLRDPGGPDARATADGVDHGERSAATP